MNSNFFESIDKETQSTNQSSIWTKYEPSMVLGNKIYEGMLLKASKSSGSALDMRYFILQENYLIYKQTEESSTISSALKIKYAQIKFPTEEELESTHSKSVGNKFAIKICSRGKYSVLFARNQEEYQIWMAQLSKAMFRIDFHTKYQVTKAIGQGAFANVYEAISRANPEQKFAVKGFNKSVLDSQPREKQSLWNEITILRQLDHPNLLRLHEVHETQNSLYLVSEIVTGGELAQFMDQGKTLNEIDLRNVAIGLARGINKLAKMNLVHRDLKPNNVLLRKTSNITPDDVVIVDFGLATNVNTTTFIFKRCGTPGYIAPEIISSANPEHDFKVTTKSDMFGLGALIYALICKRNPFENKGEAVDQIIRANLDCKVNYTDPAFNAISANWKHLLQNLLVTEPSLRMDAPELLAHDLFFGTKKHKESLSTMADDSVELQAAPGSKTPGAVTTTSRPESRLETPKESLSPVKSPNFFPKSPNMSGFVGARKDSLWNNSHYSFRKTGVPRDSKPDSGCLFSPNPSSSVFSDCEGKKLPIIAPTTAPSKFSRAAPTAQVKLPYLVSQPRGDQTTQSPQALQF